MIGSRRCYWKESTPTKKLDARRWSSCPTSTWFTEYAVVYSRNVTNTLWTFICLATWTCLEIRMQCATVECVYTMCVFVSMYVCVCAHVSLCVCVCVGASIFLVCTDCTPLMGNSREIDAISSWCLGQLSRQFGRLGCFISLYNPWWRRWLPSPLWYTALGTCFESQSSG